jgi:hypothetical protein
MNDEFNDHFEETMYDLLSGAYPNLNDIERDFAITYGIRNNGAHRLESRPIIYNRTRELTQSMLNALFFTIENLY